MRAAWCERLGPPSAITVVDRPDPVPSPGQAVVRVAAAAVNFPDVLIAAGAYQVRVPPPFTPGSEFAGTVQSVGTGVSPELVGRRVSGAVMNGAFAEQVAVPAKSLRPTPDGLGDADAAAFSVAYETAYHSLFTFGEARPGDPVVVLGAAGGVGLACVDIGARRGLEVIACASSAERVQLCLDRGAAAGIDYTTEDLKARIKELTGVGAQVVVDVVGGPYSEPALRATAWGGRFVVVGFASGEIPRIPLNLVLLKGVVVRGFEGRTLPRYRPDAIERADRDLADLVAGGLRPHVSRTYPLDRVADALDDVAQRRVAGKVVIEMA